MNPVKTVSGGVTENVEALMKFYMDCGRVFYMDSEGSLLRVLSFIKCSEQRGKIRRDGLSPQG